MTGVQTCALPICISRSIYMEILDKNIIVDEKLVLRLVKELDSLIDRNLPFKRKIVSNDQAAEFYQNNPTFQDKLAILKYRPEKTVHFYECDGYINYMYGYMVPTTGRLKKYKLMQYNGGILIRYPRSESNGIPQVQCLRRLIACQPYPY